MDSETSFIKHCAALKLGLPALFYKGRYLSDVA